MERKRMLKWEELRSCRCSFNGFGTPLTQRLLLNWRQQRYSLPISRQFACREQYCGKNENSDVFGHSYGSLFSFRSFGLGVVVSLPAAWMFFDVCDSMASPVVTMPPLRLLTLLLLLLLSLSSLLMTLPMLLMAPPVTDVSLAFTTPPFDNLSSNESFVSIGNTFNAIASS